MIRSFSFAALILMCCAIAVDADIIGEVPLTDVGTPDGWSGITVMDGYGGIPAGQNVVTVNYGAVADRADGTRHIQPLIAKEEGGAYTIWEVGPVDTPTSGGVYSVPWTSSAIPNDGNTYHPAVWQWEDGVDNVTGGTIPFGDGGSGMFQSDRDGTTYVPAAGDPLDAGHSSGAGGRSYQLNFETVPEPHAVVLAALAILPFICLRRRKK